jgi:hypothetical protein
LKKISKLECRFQRGDIFLIDVSPEMENSGEIYLKLKIWGKLLTTMCRHRGEKQPANEEGEKSGLKKKRDLKEYM